MKNRTFRLLIPLMVSVMLSGCGAEKGTAAAPPDDGRIHAVSQELFTDNDKEYTFYAELMNIEPSADTENDYDIELSAYIYEQFPAEKIDALKAGDIIVANISAEAPEKGETTDVTVETVENTGYGGVTINGGFENGGFYLCTTDNEYYYVVEHDDYKFLYPYADDTQVFKQADDFVFVDNSDWDNPGAEYDFDGFLKYFQEHKTEMNRFNTMVTTKNGAVCRVERIFTP